MSKLENLKDKALAALGTIIDKSSDLYESAEEKAKQLAKTTKLKAEIVKDNAELKRLYTDLGSLYYCLNKDNPDEALAQLCSDIKLVLDKIDVKQCELEELAANSKDIEIEITEESVSPEEPEETENIQEDIE